MPVKPVPNPAKFLHQSGLLFRINKEILHPLGLALAVIMDDNSEELSSPIEVLDGRSDPEGWVFTNDSYQIGLKKVEEYMTVHGNNALSSRLTKLGFTVQDPELNTQNIEISDEQEVKDSSLE